MDQIPVPPQPSLRGSALHNLALPDPLPLEQPLDMVETPLPSVKLGTQVATAFTPPVQKTQIPPAPPPYIAPSHPVSGEVTLPKAAPVERPNPVVRPESHIRKKIIISMFFAILFVGALVAGVLFLTQRREKIESERIATPEVLLPTTPTESVGPVALTLSLTSPKDGQTVTIGKVTVSGTTAPNSVIVFYTETSQDSVESQETGNFQGEISLLPGSNELIIVAINEKGEKTLQTRSVIYEAIESADASPSGEKAEKAKQQLIQGLITGVNDSVVTILSQDQDEEFYDMADAASTIIKVKGKGVATLNNLELGQKAVIVGTVDDKHNSILAKLIHTISKIY